MLSRPGHRCAFLNRTLQIVKSLPRGAMLCSAGLLNIFRFVLPCSATYSYGEVGSSQGTEALASSGFSAATRS